LWYHTFRFREYREEVSMDQVVFVVDCRPVQASAFFMQGFEDFRVCELLPVGDAPAPALHQWRVEVPADQADVFVQHAQAADHVVAVRSEIPRSGGEVAPAA
jgi:G3E family GTPase